MVYVTALVATRGVCKGKKKKNVKTGNRKGAAGGSLMKLRFDAFMHLDQKGGAESEGGEATEKGERSCRWRWWCSEGGQEKLGTVLKGVFMGPKLKMGAFRLWWGRCFTEKEESPGSEISN